MGMRPFQVAGGTIVGRDHRVVYKNNQDAYAIHESDGLTVVVVADGCGSSVRSEVGAQMGVRLVVDGIVRMYAATRSIDWTRLNRQIVSRLDLLAGWLGGNYREAIEQHLLFTLVGAAVANEEVIFFACGDGVIMMNGERIDLGRYPNNTPPYIAYQLLERELRIDPYEARLRPIKVSPLCVVDSFLIGTDGVEDIFQHASSCMPGLNKPVGPASQFWTDDRYFKGNPDLVSRQLRLMGRDYPATDPAHGLLHDDTTLVVARKDITIKEE